MATTTGTTAPIKPAGGAGGTVAADVMTIPCDPSVAFDAGDLIVVDGTTKDAQIVASNNIVLATNFILGVAATKAGGFTANATIDRNGTIGADLINLWPAWPGRRWTGTIIDGTSDQDGVYAEDIRTKYGTLDSADGYACINKADTVAPVAFTLEYVTPQYDSQVNSKWNYGREAGVVIKNPRVTFVFVAAATVFG